MIEINRQKLCTQAHIFNTNYYIYIFRIHGQVLLAPSKFANNFVNKQIHPFSRNKTHAELIDGRLEAFFIFKSISVCVCVCVCVCVFKM